MPGRFANHEAMIDFYRVRLSEENPRVEFANICRSCLCPYLKLRKQSYNRECRICNQPFTVVDWKDHNPDNGNARKATEICLSCSKLHIVCQCCGRGPQLEDAYSAILHQPIRERQEDLDRFIQTLQENIRLGRRVIYGPLHRPNNIRFA